MEHSWKNSLVSLSSARRSQVASLVVVSLFMTFAFILSACSENPTPLANAASNSAQTSVFTAATSYPIKVFFSKFPVSLQTNFNAVYPVNRTSPTIAVATFSIQLLIAGPTLSEQQAGYFSELNTIQYAKNREHRFTHGTQKKLHRPGGATFFAYRAC